MTATLQDLIDIGNKVAADDPSVVKIAGLLETSAKDVAQFVNREIYRVRHQNSPEAKLARRTYNQRRNAQMKLIRQKLAADPELRVQVLGK